MEAKRRMFEVGGAQEVLQVRMLHMRSATGAGVLLRNKKPRQSWLLGERKRNKRPKLRSNLYVWLQKGATPFRAHRP